MPDGEANVLSLQVGVVVARDRISHPWQEYRWRPVSVFLGAAANPDWRELMRSDTSVHYHAATVDIELHRKETAAYIINLESGAPQVYVILRLRDVDDRGISADVLMATVSPHEVQAYGHDSTEVIETVAMPEPLREVLAAFVEHHHVEETFVKRRRDSKSRDEEEHLFGQEHIDIVRRRRERNDR